MNAKSVFLRLQEYCYPNLNDNGGELYVSINMAEISDGYITHEHADYLRQKYLLRLKNTKIIKD